ncbi:MAG: hypothetical protein ACREND_18770 [Gemmatimonadaceae bacterium]
MNRLTRSALLVAAALAASACMKDSPVGPHDGSVSLRVHFQNGTPGEEIQVSIASFVPDTEGVVDSLFNGKFPVNTGTQDLTVQFDLTSCLGRFTPDEQGPFCMIEATITLLDNGVIRDQQFTGSMIVRPGQVVQTQPVVLTAGNSPPVITALDTARIVEPGLIRYTLTGNDPDGDLTTLQAIDIVDGVNLDVETPYSFFPPLTNIGGIFYALQTPFIGANSIEVFLTDSKFNSSATDTTAALSAIGDVFVDSLSVDTTADSIIVNVTPAIDSLELVFLDTLPGGAVSLSFSCGAAAPVDFSQNRFACARPAQFASSIVIAVPVDFSGRPGNGMRCPVPTASCLTAPVGDRIEAAKRPRIAHKARVAPTVRVRR